MNDLIKKDFFTPFKVFDDLFASNSILDLDKIFDDLDYITPKMPPTDIYLDDETKDLTFEFALAGYNKDDVEIDFSGDFLELRVSKKKEKNEKRCLKKGIRYSEIKNRYAVPNSKYKQDETKASFNNGILKIFVPAREKERKRSITIDTS